MTLQNTEEIIHITEIELYRVNFAYTSIRCPETRAAFVLQMEAEVLRQTVGAES
ncbi:MAG: hypothetical protein AAFQ58_23640 [Pseudomonadota bacterium]